MAQAAGFHAERGNTLLDDGAALTGEVGEPILGREAKLRGAGRSGNALGIALAADPGGGRRRQRPGDDPGGGLGVAYHAKPVVAAAAGAAIRDNDLTALLYLQGYSDSEIVAA